MSFEVFSMLSFLSSKSNTCGPPIKFKSKGGLFAKSQAESLTLSEI